jgi:hypothetical protein
MDPLIRACSIAQSKSRKNPGVDFYVIYCREDFGDYHVCRDEDFDGYFLGVSDNDIQEVFCNGMRQY